MKISINGGEKGFHLFDFVLVLFIWEAGQTGGDERNLWPHQLNSFFYFYFYLNWTNTGICQQSLWHQGMTLAHFYLFILLPPFSLYFLLKFAVTPGPRESFRLRLSSQRKLWASVFQHLCMDFVHAHTVRAYSRWPASLTFVTHF